jgi:hypothetical protein
MRDSSNAPSMSRRSMMRGLAFALAGASVPVAAIAGVTARKLVAAPQADPEIAEIQAKLDTAFNAYRRAVNVRKDICREWMPRWPEPPKEILCAGAGFGYDMERDLTGYAIKDENDKRIYVHRAKDLRSFLSRAKGKARQKTLRQQIAIANAFEQQKEQIRTLSRYEAANADYWSTAEEVRSIIQAIMDCPGEDLQDNLLKAHALVVLSRMDYILQLNLEDSHLWGPRIASAFLAHLKKGA